MSGQAPLDGKPMASINSSKEISLTQVTLKDEMKTQGIRENFPVRMQEPVQEAHKGAMESCPFPRGNIF